jgi:hypothetical protein
LLGSEKTINLTLANLHAFAQLDASRGQFYWFGGLAIPDETSQLAPQTCLEHITMSVSLEFNNAVILTFGIRPNATGKNAVV